MKKLLPLLIFFSLSCTTSPARVLSLTSLEGSGSAFVLQAYGDFHDSLVIVTARHCVTDQFGNLLPVVLIEGVPCTDIRPHPTADIAAIIIPRAAFNGRVFSALPVGDPNRLQPGDPAVAWGLHYASGHEPVLTAYVGTIITPTWHDGDGNTYVASNSGAYWGCSGGPILNSRGQVIGVISCSPPGDISIILAVPITLIDDLIGEK